jgi:hypothetical protein
MGSVIFVIDFGYSRTPVEDLGADEIFDASLNCQKPWRMRTLGVAEGAAIGLVAWTFWCCAFRSIDSVNPVEPAKLID